MTVYAMDGKEVYALEADSTGKGFWPGTNQAGQKVVSGVYYVYVQGAGASKTVKVVIQR
ncbi:MAG: T9SS type A sorting domain-containing protein [Elusimicrobia bacterium]|nr:T9SS type A sorting domain-containing protein [Elusimicrobiota bacterium]